jgi:DNA-binding NarL/FixJ family response regulator
MWLHQPQRGQRLAANVVASARERGAAAILPSALRPMAFYDLVQGRWAAAYIGLSEAVTLAQEFDQLPERCLGLRALAWIEAAQGREQACRVHINEAIELANALEQPWSRMNAEGVVGLLELSLGRLDTAIVQLEPVHEWFSHSAVATPDFDEFFGPDLVEAYARSGRAAEARQALASLTSTPSVAQQSWFPALEARCHGLVADEGDFEPFFLAALRHHQEGEEVFAEARTRLCFGERLRRARRKGDARDQLRAALAAFEQLGATPWAQHTRRELRATSVTLRRRDPTAAEELTPQELQIAVKVAQGMTNREVAAALYLSPKTIEFHLGRVFRKLAIHSRAELIRRFATETVAPADFRPDGT